MSDTKLICFYLPQFHPIPENDQWWGPGFTEWNMVVRAKPLFPGHFQPTLPGELGFYDLRVPETRQKQADLASSYGIHGFCYYYYWFGGKRLLERPFEEVLASGKPDFPFCLCWANENWSRRWDGSEHEILMEQTYKDEDAASFIDTLLPAFKDPRYIRVDNKPLFVVYNVGALVNPAATAALWKKLAQDAGLPGLYLVRAETLNNFGDPAKYGFDAQVEFPPLNYKSERIDALEKMARVGSSPQVWDYEDTAFHSIQRQRPDYKLLRSLIVAWDNTPRRPDKPSLHYGSTPKNYGRWLNEMIKWTRRHHQGDERLVFINAWNEWGEGTYLEPDERYGRKYLEETLACIRQEVEQDQFYSYDKTMACGEFTLSGDELRKEDAILKTSDSIKGSVETVHSDQNWLTIAGWVNDEQCAAEALQLLLFHGNSMLCTERTTIYRADCAANLGLAAVRSGFQISLDLRKNSNFQLKTASLFAFSSNQTYRALDLNIAGDKK